MESYGYTDEFGNSLDHDLVDEFNLTSMKVFCSAVQETEWGLYLIGVVTNTFRGDEELLGEPCILRFDLNGKSMDDFYRIIKLLNPAGIPEYFRQDLKDPESFINRSFHVIVEAGFEKYSKGGDIKHNVKLLYPDYSSSFNYWKKGVIDR